MYAVCNLCYVLKIYFCFWCLVGKFVVDYPYGTLGGMQCMT